MRPSRRLLALALAALGLSAVILALPNLPAPAALMLWLGLGVAMAVDLLISPSRRALSLQADGPADVFTGQALPLTAELRSSRPLPPRITARLALPQGLSGNDSFTLSPIDGGATGATALTGARRGQWRIDRIWLRWSSALGLFDITPSFVADIPIRVIPNVLPISSGIIDVQVRSALFGMKENLMVGEGSEFHQLREFTTGMDTRQIDWKRSAAHRELTVREMRAERNHQIILALDNGYLMREEIAGLPKIDHAVNAALATAWAAGLGGDLVGLYAYDSQPRHYVPPRPGRAAFPALRAQMAGLDYASVETNHTLGLTHLGQQLRRRALIVIFSDFVDTITAELLVENVAVLAKTHVILFVTLRDAALADIAEGASDSLTDVARAVTAAEMLRERRLVHDRLARLGVMILDTAPDRLTPELVSRYITIKARELI